MQKGEMSKKKEKIHEGGGKEGERKRKDFESVYRKPKEKRKKGGRDGSSHIRDREKRVDRAKNEGGEERRNHF